MDPERLEVDVFFDWGNWTLGVAIEGYSRYRIGVVTVGPLVVFVTYRL